MHCQRTAEDWLASFDLRRDEEVLPLAHGGDSALWMRRVRPPHNLAAWRIVAHDMASSYPLTLNSIPAGRGRARSQSGESAKAFANSVR